MLIFWGRLPMQTFLFATENRDLAGRIVRVSLPPCEHRHKVIPAVQHHHHQMAEYKSDDRPHHDEVPNTREMKPTHHPREPGKLDRLPHCDSGENGKDSQNDRRGVSKLL